MGITTKLFALIGLTLGLIIVTGIYLDIRNFDQTKGGYEPPFTGATGASVDWASLDLASSGLAKRGYVINVLVNGTTGMINFEIFKQKFGWRIFSERALIVHKPREALIQRGFTPEF
ncbi:MAG: hypothetical protein OEU50_08680 [Gammaproteobacteria bacterium]|nr:hypothetical protein [Gammaproteobacteria bacterium]